MCRPAAFAADDEVTLALVDAHPLAHLVVTALVGVTYVGKTKLSQNKGADDVARIAAGLAAGSPTDQTVAAAMQD